MICVEDVLQILDDSLSLNALVEFAKEGDGFLGARLSDTVGGVEEEIVASVCGRSDGGIQDGEVTDAWKDEVLEDGGGSGGRRDDQDAGGFESGLSGGGPDARGGVR